MISAYISGINDCQSESAHCSFGFKNLNECLITSDLWGTMWFLSLLWNTAKALHPHEDIWGSVGVHNHSVISGLSNLLLGVFRSVWYIPCTAVVRAQLASCSFSVGIALWQSCSLYVAIVCFSLVVFLDRISHLFTDDVVLQLYWAATSTWLWGEVRCEAGGKSVSTSTSEVVVLGCCSKWSSVSQDIFECVSKGGSESCTNLLLWRELSVKVKLVIYRSIHITSSALGSDWNNEMTDTSARKHFCDSSLLETRWGGAQSRAAPPPD